MTRNVQAIMDNRRRCSGYVQNTFGMVYHKIAIIMWSPAKSAVQVSFTWTISRRNPYVNNTNWYSMAIHRISKRKSLHCNDVWSIFGVARVLCHPKSGSRASSYVFSWRVFCMHGLPFSLFQTREEILWVIYSIDYANAWKFQKQIQNHTDHG